MLSNKFNLILSISSKITQLILYRQSVYLKANKFCYQNLSVSLLNNEQGIADSRVSQVWWPILIQKIQQEFGENKTYLKSCHHHSIVASISLSDINNTKRIEELIHKTNLDVLDTHPVLESFVKGWIGKIIKPCVKEKIEKKVLEYGELFLTFHYTTLIMNAKTKFEYDNLKTLTNLSGEWDEDSESNISTILDPNLGKIMICGAFIVLIKHSLVLDRDFMLMMKDMWLARFNSLMSLINRCDDKFPKMTLYNLIEMYKIGDHMIMNNGNTGYNGVKLLEPMCVLRLSQIARTYRPKVPLFNSFPDHIKKSINENIESSNYLKQWENLLQKINSPDEVIAMYGSFRHWGHPYIDYLTGLEMLNAQTNIEKNIDIKYANALASDLAKMVIHKQFREKKVWPVDIKLMKTDHKLYNHIKNHTWPTVSEVREVGDSWNTLPLIKCFEIPDVVDLSILYSDKSHSMQRQEVIDYIRRGDKRHIPTRKVLTTLINTPATDWPTFLQKVNDTGLDHDDLVMGLKGKERELKIVGRFFALMSWKMREYFVITEYLIKTHFVPLFQGLTMADDLTELTKKMLDTSYGQGLLNYESICISNHFDYEKWNNHQRLESTGPIFTVMGQFLGYPKLIYRTHEFFQKCLVYYNERPDLMGTDNTVVWNTSPATVVWEGQKGGIDGLRQKGWSILNLLVIQRESKIRNTTVHTLAQGDNQVICTQYKLPNVSNELELEKTLKNMVHNNSIIISSITEGTTKLGLIVNEDETLQSADLLVYGKVPIFRGNIMGLDNKRYSRISCVSNDQIPTIGNIMSTVTTNLLTVSHFSSSPVEPMRQHNFFGNLNRIMIEEHDPVLQDNIKSYFKYPKDGELVTYKMAALYLDPSLGGVCGTSLSRFLIRMFPDPITESLSFWKLVHDNTNSNLLKNLAKTAGNPDLADFNLDHLEKLFESPTSLNIVKNISVIFLLKQEIKKTLQNNPEFIKNQIIKEAIIFSRDEESKVRHFLFSIKPFFPRFLSEFRSATFLGMTDTISGLFQNSRTIRNHFKAKMSQKMNKVLIKSERSSIDMLIEIGNRARYSVAMWKCSSSHADLLRQKSWKNKVLGATVPHPLEMIKETNMLSPTCRECSRITSNENYLTTTVPHGLKDYYTCRGPLKVYLGSKTMESTSLMQPWEKEAKIPLLARASKLRNAIHWFVEPGSNLANSIISILEGLTGDNWSTSLEGFKRTGSSLHRFSSSRQSAGGYCASSPVKLSRMNTTTDTMVNLGSENYDFMFQALIIHAQVTVGEMHDGKIESGLYHSHISCSDCLRKIDEPVLESSISYKHPNITNIINRLIPENCKIFENKLMIPIPVGDWTKISSYEGSYHIGRSIGFLYGDTRYSKSTGYDLNSLFPLSLKTKLNPLSFMEGLLDGLLRVSSINILHRRSSSDRNSISKLLRGSILFLIIEITKLPAALNLFRSSDFMNLFLSLPHKTPASYPLTTDDLGQLTRSYLEVLIASPSFDYGYKYKSRYQNIWIFSDLYLAKPSGLVILSKQTMKLVTNPNKLSTKNGPKTLMRLKKTIESLKSENSDWVAALNTNHIYLCDHEIRSAAKSFGNFKPDIIIRDKKNIWKEIKDGSINKVKINYYAKQDKDNTKYPIPKSSNCPLVSGLRIVQVATGSHYKIRSLLSNYSIKYKDFLSGGDGSGGLTALYLRWNITSRGIFNSLLDYDGVDMRGSKPSPPTALLCGSGIESRCVNHKDCWENPSDLSSANTWIYFMNLIHKYSLHIDLMSFDLNIISSDMTSKIELNLIKYISKILTN